MIRDEETSFFDTETGRKVKGDHEGATLENR